MSRPVGCCISVWPAWMLLVPSLAASAAWLERRVERVRLNESGWTSPVERVRLNESGWTSLVEWVRLNESGWMSPVERVRLIESGWMISVEWVRLNGSVTGHTDCGPRPPVRGKRSSADPLTIGHTIRVSRRLRTTIDDHSPDPAADPSVDDHTTADRSVRQTHWLWITPSAYRTDRGSKLMITLLIRTRIITPEDPSLYLYILDFVTMSNYLTSATPSTRILVCCFIYNYFYTISHDPSRTIV